MKLNLPNNITVLRILLTPIVIFFYLANFIPGHHLIAAILFVLAVSTDYLDGYIARKYNLVTNLGKFLDPIADKLINVSVIILLVADGTIVSPFGVLFAIVVIGRELSIGALRQVAATNGVVIAADKWGKWKTFTQDLGLPMFMLVAFASESFATLNTFFTVVQICAYVFASISLVLTIVSFINYVHKNKAIFKTEK